jgi:integrase
MKRLKQHKLNGEPHFVSLPKQAVKILEDLFALTGRTGFVFPAEGRKGRTMSNGTINAALRVLGYSSETVTGHGFRATARTMIAEVLGLDPKIVELQLAHEVPDANGSAYNRAEFILKRLEMMQQWADYLDELREDRADPRRHAVLPKFKPVTDRLAMEVAS